MSKTKNPVTKKTASPEKSGFSIAAFLDKNEYFIAGFLCLISAYFVYSLYDFKVSLEGDDSAYIQRAVSFLKTGEFPTFQGTLYPLMLSLVMKLFGFSINKFKVFSCALAVLNTALFFFAYRKTLSRPVFWFALCVIAMNGPLMQIASLTFTETLFISLFTTSIICFNLLQKPDQGIVKELLFVLLLAVTVFLVTITKNVAMGVPVAFFLVLLFLKQWRNAIVFAGLILVFNIAFNFIQFDVYKVDHKTINAQREMILMKNSYNPAEGKEDAKGFTKRFTENMQSYISKHFYSIIGLRTVEFDQEGRPVEANSMLLTLFTIALFGFAFYSAIKEKNSVILILVLAAAAISAITFLIQIMWDNQRLILTMVPVYVILMFYSIDQIFQSEKLKSFKLIAIIFFAIVGLANVNKAFTMSGENSEQLNAGMSGNELYGFPAPFASYIQMVQWSSKNVPNIEKDRVACRKPDIAFVYSGGVDFYGIWRTPAQGTPADSLISQLRTNHVRYVIDDQIFPTVHNYLSMIAAQYPQIIKPVYKITSPVETNLYKIEY